MVGDDSHEVNVLRAHYQPRATGQGALWLQAAIGPSPWCLSGRNWLNMVSLRLPSLLLG